MSVNILEPLIILGIFILTCVGGLMVWQLRVLHNRIDRVKADLAKHIHESIAIHRSLARLEALMEQQVRDRDDRP